MIEDDRDIAHLVQMHLRDMGCQVTVTHNGQQGLDLAMAQQFDLIVLDLMIPGMDGLEVCRRLRARPPYTPILMLTAKSTELDRV
ncbi:MAG: response regulator, partial [Gammaproteobacteria bacterium]